jgi:hypothetical protein
MDGRKGHCLMSILPGMNMAGMGTRAAAGGGGGLTWTYDGWDSAGNANSGTQVWPVGVAAGDVGVSMHDNGFGSTAITWNSGGEARFNNTYVNIEACILTAGDVSSPPSWSSQPSGYGQNAAVSFTPSASLSTITMVSSLTRTSGTSATLPSFTANGSAIGYLVIGVTEGTGASSPSFPSWLTAAFDEYEAAGSTNSTWWGAYSNAAYPGGTTVITGLSSNNQSAAIFEFT